MVDDDARLGASIRRALAYEGYSVDVVANGADALVGSRDQPPDLVVLDVMLPGIDGIEVCRRLRAGSDVPILMLTARDAVSDRVAGLDAGADDYVTKPFSTPELLARVRVALRRRRDDDRDDAVLTVGDLVVDIPRHTVNVAGRAVDLTPKEFGFLALLARQPGRVLTHRTILQEVWGPEYGRETQYLRVYASQLRRKLEEDRARPRLVTAPGVGYRLVDREDGL